MKSFLSQAKREFKESTPLEQLKCVLRYLGILIACTASFVAIGTAAFGSREAERVVEVQQAIIVDLEETEAVINGIIGELIQEDICKIQNVLMEVAFDDLDMDVEFKFIASDDYRQALIGTSIAYDVGQYIPTESATQLMGRIFDKAIDRKLGRYVEHLNVAATIRGVADPIPVRPGARYLGPQDIANVQYYNINEQRYKWKTLVSGKTRLVNEDFAFLRAFYVREEVQDLGIFREAPISIEVVESDTTGDRGVIFVVELKVRDILRESYDELSPFGKINFALTK